jgi:general secretion pathway protein K
MMTTSSRGSALLAVLWLSAALAAIAFSLSSTVRSETGRASTSVDGLRAYYLAQGGVERAAMELLWRAHGIGQPKIPLTATAVNYAFPSGDVRVEIIPEASKLNVNVVPVQDLYRVTLALGVDPARAQEIAEAIDDWRRPMPAGSRFDLYYSSQFPSFRAAHASIQEIEELLLVKGVTSEIFYGTYVPSEGDPSGVRLSPRYGLADCLSVYDSGPQVDANTAAPPVLAALGLPPDAINALMAQRRVAPLTGGQLASFLQSTGAPTNRLRTGANSMVLLRATARLRLANGQPSDLQRTVAARVKYLPAGFDPPMHILRWYDRAWSH